MRKIIIALLSLIMVIMFACSGNVPDGKLKEINGLMSKNIPMTAEQRSKVEKYIAEGKGLMGQGKTDDSIKAFDEALKVIKTAQDAAIYNAAE